MHEPRTRERTGITPDAPFHSRSTKDSHDDILSDCQDNGGTPPAGVNTMGAICPPVPPLVALAHQGEEAYRSASLDGRGTRGRGNLVNRLILTTQPDA